MSKRSFRIEFIRKADEDEKRYQNDWYDEDACLIYDATEFDTEYQTDEVAFVDLINLFNDFVAENNFEDVTVTELEEVPYDGEDE